MLHWFDEVFHDAQSRARIREEPLVRALMGLNRYHLEHAITDFLKEEKLVGEFLVWVEKWKILHGLK